ncbi:MAG: VOC family protein [Candidatus Saccharimonadales bacterium]
MAQFGLFINFNGNCREAVDFYAGVFNSKVENLMTFGEAPVDPSMPIKESEKDRIMYAEVKIGQLNIMFMDNSDDWPLTIGNNIQPTINVDSEEELRRISDALGVDGKTLMPPTKTFFAPLYAMVEDKFGVNWHVLLNEK